MDEQQSSQPAFDKLISEQAKYKTSREDKYKQDSRDRLSKILRKKVETTMIGALSSVEEHFSFLWSSDGALTPEQQMMYDTFQKVRSEILDKGNGQARNIDAELAQYEVKWLRYQTTIPIIPRNRTQEDTNE
jgi:transcription termination factor Rho